MIQLRCEAKLHGILLEPGTGILEVACMSVFCGKRAGVVVRHQFDLSSGELINTKCFKDPIRKKVNRNGEAVRSS